MKIPGGPIEDLFFLLQEEGEVEEKEEGKEED